MFEFGQVADGKSQRRPSCGMNKGRQLHYLLGLSGQRLAFDARTVACCGSCWALGHRQGV